MVVFCSLLVLVLVSLYGVSDYEMSSVVTDLEDCLISILSSGLCSSGFSLDKHKTKQVRDKINYKLNLFSFVSFGLSPLSNPPTPLPSSPVFI